LTDTSEVTRTIYILPANFARLPQPQCLCNQVHNDLANIVPLKFTE
jgi:hypothetical protein